MQALKLEPPAKKGPKWPQTPISQPCGPSQGGVKKLKHVENAFFGSASSAPFERYVARVSEMQALNFQKFSKNGPKWPQTPVFRGLQGEKTPKIFPGPYGRIAPGGVPPSTQPGRGERERERGENRDNFFYGELGNLGEPN